MESGKWRAETYPLLSTFHSLLPPFFPNICYIFKVKKIICLLTAASVFFIAVSCGVRAEGADKVVLYENGGTNETVILENEFLELRFLPGTAEIVLKEKSGGAQWYSNPWGGGLPDDARADYTTMQLMKSQFSLRYANMNGAGMTLYSGANSVERGAYEYALVDGGLEVNYTVGSFPRSYRIPSAVTEERFRAFLDKVSPDGRRKIDASYRLYDVNNLFPDDDKSALLSRYPDLAKGRVYVLRDVVQDWMKGQIEGFLSAAGYTDDDYLSDTAKRPPESLADDRPVFNITLRYALDGKSLLVSVPFDRVAWRAAYPVVELSLLPYMGSGGIADQGYLLVPDGSGALLYFNNGKHSQNVYSNRVYGWDEAVPRDAVISDNRASFPAFGIQKNGSALLCVIEEGSSYAAVWADVSGRNSSWNCVYPRFDMIHGATLDVSGRTEQLVYLFENRLPPGENITLRYTPCAAQGYVGMAKEYRSWLLDKHPGFAGPARGKTETGVPVAVEIVGAVTKTQHRLGIPFDLPLKLTSYAETEAMLDDFAGLGWENLRVKLSGWFNDSVDHSVPSRLRLIGELGSGKDFRNLVSAARQYGYELFPEADFVYMRNLRSFDGFNLYRDTARYPNRKRAARYPYSFVWFGEDRRGKLSYFARPAYTAALIGNFMEKAEKLGLKNIAFRSMGARLGGDYNEKRPVSREASMRMRQEKLAGLSAAGTGIMLQTGYMYAAPWADFITDMDLDDQGFGITDVSVPFFQIALHGLVPYTGRAINLAEDYSMNLLKTIESGAGLYFSFMAEDTAVLQETKFRQFYANEYRKWAPDADALYRKFSTDFKGLYNQAIQNHVILSPEVTETEYEDGTRVVVNRSEYDFSYRDIKSPKMSGDIVIEAGSYAVLRQEG